MHPAVARGFAEGDLVRLESEVGSLVFRLRLDPRQRRDVALTTKGGWLGDGRCANALVAERTDANTTALNARCFDVVMIFVYFVV